VEDVEDVEEEDVVVEEILVQVTRL